MPTGGYAARRASCERGARVLGVGALRDLDVADLPRAARSRRRDVPPGPAHRHRERTGARTAEPSRPGRCAIGDLLDASHLSMRDDFEISCPELDLAVDTARANGAIGARMTGGGFGGSAIALVPVDDADQVRSAVLAGFAVPGAAGTRCLRRPAGRGARRL